MKARSRHRLPAYQLTRLEAAAYQPDDGTDALAELARAVALRAAASAYVDQCVEIARRPRTSYSVAPGHNWEQIGAVLGVSGAAAAKKYGDGRRA